MGQLSGENDICLLYYKTHRIICYIKVVDASALHRPIMIQIM